MNLEVGQFCSILLSSTPDIRLIIRGVAFRWECPSIRGDYCTTLKKQSVVLSTTFQLRNLTASQFKWWRKLEYSDQLQTDKTLSHDVYSTSLYDPKLYIGKTTYIWVCWLHLVLPSTCHSMLCCELEFAKLIYKG